MAIDALSAAKAYQQAAKAAEAPGVAGGDEVGGADFGSFLQSAIKDATSSMAVAEQQSVAAATGKADIVNVVTAIAAAESTLETVVAVRDQVIQAYQEILRMPI